jgi:PAS domain S-box-containing protein
VDDWRQELGTLRVRNAELNARYQATLRQLDDMAENMTQFERDALEVRQRLIAIVQYAPIAVIEWRLDRSIAVWNPAAEKLLGYAASDVLGHDLFSVIVPDREAKSMLNTWKNLMDLTGDHHSTHQTITKDGRTVVCDWFNRPVMANNGTIISIISVLQEVLL